MRKYHIFLALFVISVIAGILCFTFYLQGIFGTINEMHRNDGNSAADAFEIMTWLFTPQLLFSFAITVVTGLAYRIHGIVMVAQNKTVSDGEKALWIVGLLIMGFITAIVFLILAKGRKFVE